MPICSDAQPVDPCPVKLVVRREQLSSDAQHHQWQRGVNAEDQRHQRVKPCAPVGRSAQRLRPRQQGAASPLKPRDTECNRERNGDRHRENLRKLERLCPVRAIRFGVEEPFLMSVRRVWKGQAGEKGDQGNAGVCRMVFAHHRGSKNHVSSTRPECPSTYAARSSRGRLPVSAPACGTAT